MYLPTDHGMAQPQAENHAQQLLAAVTDLKRHQLEVLNLFKSVSANLRPILGDSHRLYLDWKDLREEYDKLVASCRREASKCATHLSQFTVMLPHILEPNTSLEVKQLIVSRFIQEAQKGCDKASESEDQFLELADRISDFMWNLTKQGTDSWKAKCHDIKALCTRAFNFLKHIATCIGIVFSSISSSQPLCSSFRNARSRLHAYKKNYRLDDLQQDPPFASDLVRRALTECHRMHNRLESIGDSWNEIKLSCNELATILELANGVLPSDITPYLQQLVEQARTVYEPLIEGLRAYSTNRAPDF
ncbi:hypothetical protein NM688_g1494 [Phlebia brevispora]|uniref:Uncharacterized protein n=1 Tax=Phlebia brevispora TaxID=194682 RepID=A0ACC1TB46_9APHY|nr:hypothetical protein NM688_g1494 [Phlebia brevispora]